MRYLPRFGRALKRPLIHLLVWGGIAVCGAGDAAGQAPKVEVQFVVKEPLYAGLFTTDSLGMLEASAAGLVAGFLHDRLPVLDLETGRPADYRLVVELDRRGGETANQLQADRGFYVHLVGPDSATERTWVGLFRRSTATGTGFGGGGGVPLFRVFLEKIQLALSGLDVDALVRDHVSRIPLTRVGQIWRPPPEQFGWVAGLDREQLCLARGTGLRVLVLLPSAFDTIPAERIYQAEVQSDFLAHRVFGDTVPPAYASLTHAVFARPEPAQQSGLDLVQGNAAARVAAVFLMNFQLDSGVCQRLQDPAAAEANAGGAP